MCVKWLHEQGDQVNDHTDLSEWAVDEWTYHLFQDPQVARQRLELHWQTFITR